jgi:hypothetical protein
MKSRLFVLSHSRNGVECGTAEATMEHYGRQNLTAGINLTAIIFGRYHEKIINPKRRKKP